MPFMGMKRYGQASRENHPSAWTITNPVGPNSSKRVGVAMEESQGNEEELLLQSVSQLRSATAQALIAD